MCVHDTHALKHMSLPENNCEYGIFPPLTPYWRWTPLLFTAPYLRLAGRWASGHFPVFASRCILGLQMFLLHFPPVEWTLGIWTQGWKLPEQVLYPPSHSTGYFLLCKSTQFVSICHCRAEKLIHLIINKYQNHVWNKLQSSMILSSESLELELKGNNFERNQCTNGLL